MVHQGSQHSLDFSNTDYDELKCAVYSEGIAYIKYSPLSKSSPDSIGGGFSSLPNIASHHAALSIDHRKKRKKVQPMHEKLSSFHS